jgi:hypothetical protein
MFHFINNVEVQVERIGVKDVGVQCTLISEVPAATVTLTPTQQILSYLESSAKEDSSTDDDSILSTDSVNFTSDSSSESV